MATTNKFFKVKNGLDVNSNATVDASGNANLAGNITANSGYVSADTFRLDTTFAGGSTQIGEFSWDPDNETARLLLDGVNLQIGQEHVIRVKNASGSVPIPDRTPVMFAGATGDTVTVAPAVSSNVAVYPSDYMVGITTEEIPADGFGFVTQFGFINQVNTTAWTVGTLLYVDPATAGGLTSTRPTAPAWQTPIAAVTKQNGSAGRILVRAIPGININRVEGVELTTPATNDILHVNSTGIVVNSSLSSANIANLAATGTQTFSGNVAGTNLSMTGNVNATTDVNVGGKINVNARSGDEGGEIFLANAVTNTSIANGVTVDVYQNKLRFFEAGGTARGAYLDLTAAASGVGTNLLGSSGAMNYAIQESTKQSGISANATTIVSKSFTTNGYPVQVLVTGDAENSTAGGWVKLQLFRDSTAIGKIIHVEMSAASENVPYSLTVIDAPAAGTYTYALKTVSVVSTGTMNFGETDGPVLTLVELAGRKGDTGSSGGISTITFSSPLTGGTITTSGTVGINASSSNTVNYVVQRDSDGSFAGNVITATTFSGSASGLTAIPAANLTGTAANIVYTANIGSTVQAYDADLTAIAGLANATGYLYNNGTGTFSYATPTDTNTTYTLAAGGTTSPTVTLTPSSGTANTITFATSGTGISFGQTGGTITITSNASDANGASTLVARNSTGNFAGNVITATDLNATNVTVTGALNANLTGYAKYSIADIQQKTTSYTLVLTDANDMIEVSNAAATTITVPTNANVAYPVKTEIHILQTGAGQVSVAGDTGVTVNGTPGLKLRAQWSMATLIKRDTNTWVFVGDLTS